MKTGSGEAHGLRSAIVFLIGGAGLVFGLYFLQFHGALSESRDDWAAFGSYASGAFSFLTLCGVAFTIKLQADQLKLIRAQGNLEELQRLLATSSTNLDRALETAVQPDGVLKPVAFFTMLMTMCHAVETSGQRAEETLGFELAVNGEHMLPLAAVIQKLEQLCQCLELFRARGGSEDIITLYVDRYSVLLLALFRLEQVPDWCKYIRTFKGSADEKLQEIDNNNALNAQGWTR